MKKYKRPILDNFYNRKITNLYKYRELNEYTERLIFNRELYFSSPNDFNDPFDCQSVTIYRGNYQKWKNFFSQSGIPAQTSEQLALQNADRDISEDQLPLSSTAGDINRIFCFSKSNNVIPLWSHYANNHQGLCVSFKVLNDKGAIGLQLEDGQLNTGIPILNNIIIANRVLYGKKMPQPWLRWQDDPSYIYNFFQNKHNSWKYEEEYRALTLDSYMIKHKNILIAAKGTIDAIYLGAKIPVIDRNKYLQKIKIYNSNNIEKIKVYQMIADKKSYKLKPEQVTP
ncbi:PF11185 family protein [Leptospira wolbachii serovar Codice str. CDC]|uniref:PF11185 family protein n=1 Tax=Leptospira wolbachii serovar Codice str. CDC TaxID=1218599 RepID=R9A7W5_9LEPT|nr:DUF2971 domain-containing protein [Leptospira wolbachii]EOQ98278.1 PF11185 family protein [Leptospira wolbachii serovar Codice str. CDC]